MKRLLVICAIAFVCVGCDQVSKNIVRNRLLTGEARSYFGGTVCFQYAENRGGILSMGAELAPSIRFWVFTVAVGILLLAMLVFAASSRTIGPMERWAFALIVGGGLGNLIDRMLHDGVVTDFMNVGIGFVRTGIFNAADVAVFGGGLLLALSVIRRSFQNEPRG